MKKIMIMSVALLVLLGFTNLSFAQEKKHKTTQASQDNIETIKGKVVSVDETNKQIVVKNNKTQVDMTFTVSEKTIAIVKVGNDVKVKVKAGSANAESVTVVKSKTNKK